MPRMSVNWSRRNATPCSRQRLRTSRFVAPVAFSMVAVMAGEAAGASPPPHSLASHGVKQKEFVRMGLQGHRADLPGTLETQRHLIRDGPPHATPQDPKPWNSADVPRHGE